VSDWTQSRARRLWLRLPESERIRLGSLIANPPALTGKPMRIFGKRSKRNPMAELTESEKNALLDSLKVG